MAETLYGVFASVTVLLLLRAEADGSWRPVVLAAAAAIAAYYTRTAGIALIGRWARAGLQAPLGALRYFPGALLSSRIPAVAGVAGATGARSLD